MSYAVISDVHANLHALEAVLQDINGKGITDIYFIGDAVGYGPRPNQCIDIIKQRCILTLAGNHDWAAIGYTDITYFNKYAKQAIEWTIEELSNEHMEDIKSFNLIKSSEKEDAFFAHATPMEPVLWSYLFTVEQVEKNFSAFKQSICFIGHSHLAIVFELEVSGQIYIHKDPIIIKNKQSRYIVNTGSVGQPRDNDNRSSYAVIQDDTIEIVRVTYDIEATQAEMKAAGLPEMLINRLSFGM
jgi:diadenosine tetraphosphatase ApaH/serine/threonine PP2A family protein phosphatase